MAAGRQLILNWNGYARWCGLGAVVMFVWLLVPVVTCTYDVFRDTPLGEVDSTAAPANADKDRVLEGEGFWTKLTTGAKICYRRTPLLGQQEVEERPDDRARDPRRRVLGYGARDARARRWTTITSVISVATVSQCE